IVAADRARAELAGRARALAPVGGADHALYFVTGELRARLTGGVAERGEVRLAGTRHGLADDAPESFVTEPRQGGASAGARIAAPVFFVGDAAVSVTRLGDRAVARNLAVRAWSYAVALAAVGSGDTLMRSYLGFVGNRAGCKRPKKCK